MLVSIVILTYRRAESVHTLLCQLAQLGDENLEIIVVDNGSGGDTAERIAQDHRQVQLVVLPTNRGVGSRNRGLEVARGEVIITLDDDMVDLTADSLQHLRRRFEQDTNLGALNFRVVWPGTERVRDWVHRRPSSHSRECFATYEITEGAVAWRRKALQQAGLYREDFFISHEGLELALRVLDRGWKIEYDGLVTVGHAHASGGRTSWRRYYYDTRNLFWVAALHMPFLYALRYVTVGVGAMLVYSLRDRHLWAWLKGVAHGLAGVPKFRKERKVWTSQTAAAVAEADSWRPGFWKLAGKRLRQKDFSME